MGGIFEHDPAAIAAKIKSTKEQLRVVRRQRDVLADQRQADPYDSRLPGALAQAEHRVAALEKQVGLLEREINTNRPVDDTTGRLPSGAVWVSSAYGDSKIGGGR